MRARGVTVLLVGNSTRGGATLENYFLKRGCKICFASSLKEALEFLRLHRFDLVLSDFQLSDGTAYQLMPSLRGTGTTMFFSTAVEEGYWWINAIYEGQDHSNEPGMRASQFKIVLDELLFEKRVRAAEEGRGKPGVDRPDPLAIQVHDR
jgi:hypothetical protein